ncbi:cytoplasmic tRNA 2-thiolation protein 1, partial [Phenoliferia sp. Uapishka_3]
MAPCTLCPASSPARAILRRPKTLQPVCKECFFEVFETEIHHAIMGYGQAEGSGQGSRDAKGKGKGGLFKKGERVAIGASGGKEEDGPDALPRTIKRSKPFKYTYEKEIVMYAYFKKLDYHSTECIYSPTAYRGHARALVKDLESVRPSAIVDIIYSGEAMAASLKLNGRNASGIDEGIEQKGLTIKSRPIQKTCTRCGSLTSQELCQACVLLEGLNLGVAKVSLGGEEEKKSRELVGTRDVLKNA